MQGRGSHEPADRRPEDAAGDGGELPCRRGEHREAVAALARYRLLRRVRACAVEAIWRAWAQWHRDSRKPRRAWAWRDRGGAGARGDGAQFYAPAVPGDRGGFGARDRKDPA